MYTKAILISILVAVAEARFGQEQVPIPAISSVTSGGGPGVAATLAGSAISDILAAANACAKLVKADQIIAQLGTGADALAAAKGLVAAEKNFNPFNVKIPSICSDPTLPTTVALRGIVPLIDPDVGGAATENALSAKSLVTPFANAGLSVADIMVAQGFTNFTTQSLAGVAGAAPAGGAVAVGTTAAAVTTKAAAVADAASTSAPCTTSTKMVTVTVAANAATSACPSASTLTVTEAAAATTAAAVASTSAAAAATASAAPATGSGAATKSSLGLDFGSCIPTMKFEAGLNGRKDTEFTFQAIDPIVNKGQQEALNPSIITNRICDQLTNVCGAAADAKTACLAAKAQILALGTRDVTTADTWNTALGFAGANTNPDNAPQAGLVGHS